VIEARFSRKVEHGAVFRSICQPGDLSSRFRIGESPILSGPDLALFCPNRDDWKRKNNDSEAPFGNGRGLDHEDSIGRELELQTIDFGAVKLKVRSGSTGNAKMMISSDWFVWAALSAVFAALTAIFAKIGIQGVSSDLGTLIRTGFIFLVLGAFVWFTGKWSNPFALSSKTWIFLGLSALATGASWVCYFRALQMGEASKVAPVDKFSLVLVAVFAFAFLGERPTVVQWLAIGLVSLGVVVLAIAR
jgi:bacterial/archaeal transporter family protein